LTPICTKSFVGCGFAPDPTGGAYSAPPDPLAGLTGLHLKGGEKARGEEGRERRGKERREGYGRGGRELVLCPRKKKEKSTPMR